MTMRFQRLFLQCIVLYVIGVASVWINPLFTLSATLIATAISYRNQKDFTFILTALFSGALHIAFHPNMQGVYAVYVLILGGWSIAHVLSTRRSKRLGSLGVAFLFLIDALVLRMLDATTLLEGLQGLLVIASAFVFYFLIVNAFKPRASLLNEIGLIGVFMLVLAMTMTALTVVYNVTTGPFIHYIVLVGVIVSGHMMITIKQGYWLMALYVAAGVVLLIAGALVSAISVFIVTIFSGAYALFKNPKTRLRTLGVSALSYLLTATLLMVGVNRGYVAPFTQSAREKLLIVSDSAKNAAEEFINAPIIGLAWLEGIDVSNIIVHMLSLGGLLVALFLYLQYRKIKVILKTDKIMRYFLIVLIIIGIGVHGIFEPLYFHPVYLLGLFTMIGAMEANAT